MVLSNSTPNSNSQKHNEMIINTASLRGEDLSQYIKLNEEIEQRRAQRQSMSGAFSGSALLKATMTREEVFECSTLDDDRFLSALEHQNSYVAPKVQVTDLDLSSIENLMKYFDEDMPVTPTKPMSTGKVANAIATFKSKAANLSPTQSPRKRGTNLKKKLEVRANILELKKKYEMQGAAATAEPTTPKQQTTKTQKFPMRVKEMAQLFNSKITQVMRRGSDAQNYEPLENEYSPEAKPAPQPILAPTKPAVKPRTKLPTYRIGRPSPVPSPRGSPRNSPRMRRKPVTPKVAPTTPSNTLLVAEEVFRELCVKDKALLFNKFIGDMARKNPKFNKHVEVIQENVKKQMARGEVINEKQATVKSITQELEAKCVLYATPENQLQRGQSMRIKKRNAPPPPLSLKAKEAEDVPTTTTITTTSTPKAEEEEYEDASVHVSTLTVVLKPSPDAKHGRTPVPRPRPYKSRNLTFNADISALETSFKRNNASIRSSLPTEAYAPPKKIRRTHFESKMFFQNEQLENLFYNWLKEENGVLFDITTIANTDETIEIALENTNESNSCAEVTQKSAVERLLEEAIAKLEESKLKEEECVEEKEADTTDDKKITEEEVSTKQLTVEVEETPEEALPIQAETKEETQVSTTSTPKVTPRKVKRQAPPVPAPRPSLIGSSSCGSSISSSAKQSDAEESESGLSTLPKITSDESQPETHDDKAADGVQQDFEFTKPVRPPRKKKMRRTLTWKKENSIIEANPISTTDSDSDSKQTESATVKHKPFANFAKKLWQKNLALLTPTKSQTQQLPTTEQSFAELNKSLIRQMNSPRKVKSAYTLTVISSPSPNAESDFEAETPRESLLSKRETSRSWPTALDAMEPLTSEDKAASHDLSKHQLEQRQLNDRSIDQGFETGSNDLDSPMRSHNKLTSTAAFNKLRQASPLFEQLNAELEKSYNRRNSIESNTSKKENQLGYSTPVKGHEQRTFNGSQQQAFSPIPQQLKHRRRSIYEGEPRRSSIAMQVIREDQPLDLDRDSYSGTPNSIYSPSSYNANESVFFANAPTADMPSNLDELNVKQPVSSFWITAGDFTVSAEIFYNAPDRLRLLYEIFTQKSCEARDLAFGIDGHKFDLINVKETSIHNVSERLPSSKDCSHYWFASGDLAVPFSGKHMSAEKIQRLFKFISDSLKDVNELRFGVDNIEFSNVPEFWHNSPKFSIESSYSMLVGLQTGNSNGLEGRSKYAWPNSMCSPNNRNANKTSDLDHSEFESDNLSSSGRLSFSPFGSNNFDADELNMQQNSTSPEMFSLDFENEPLDQLFVDAQSPVTVAAASPAKPQTKKPNMTVPEMVAILQKQQSKLKHVEERIRTYTNPANLSSNSLDEFKNSPDYLRKLRKLIKAIDHIGHDQGFKNCTREQLESFMFFLSRYADICLANCSEHMDKILDTLMDRRAVLV